MSTSKNKKMTPHRKKLQAQKLAAKEAAAAKRKKWIIAGVCALVCALGILAAILIINSGKNTENDAAESLPLDTQAESISAGILNPAANYFADIDIENYGTVTVQLDQAAAPITVENFVSLAESGFYDGLTFHRIMEGFMMQGGDPEGNGTGGSGKNIVGEFTNNGHENPLSHTRGAISMARESGNNDSASSQFFIVHQDSTFLDGDYAVFGYVTEGMDIVDNICTSAKPIDDNGTIPAEEQPVIRSITIRTN